MPEYVTEEKAENREEPYTVAELIAELQKLPADMRVMVPGYEGGYRDGSAPEVGDIRLNVNSEWYYGPHENAEDSAEHEELPVIKAAIL